MTKNKNEVVRITGRVNVKFGEVGEINGWGLPDQAGSMNFNIPKVLNVVATDGLPLTAEETARAIKQVLYPDGGIDWTAWSVGDTDYFEFSIIKKMENA